LPARKAVRQSYSPSEEVLSLMRSFNEMTNERIRIGLGSDASTLKRLSLLSYHSLARFRHRTKSSISGSIVAEN
jgi:hypothetical protein